MEWRDEGFLLSTRRHGESAAIIEVFTEQHGRHFGVVRGGASRKIAPILQPGAQLDLVWKARLEDHLGSFAVEPIRSRAAIAMQNRVALAGMNALLALLSFTQAEREAQPDFYHRSATLLDLLGQPDLWPLGYMRWERDLLALLGYGLDLDTCAVTGSADDLAYVSPKSGRAVSKTGAGTWVDKLLPLPDALRDLGSATNAEVLAALQVTGYFLEHKVAAQQVGQPLPPARARFVDVLARSLTNPEV